MSSSSTALQNIAWKSVSKAHRLMSEPIFCKSVLKNATPASRSASEIHSSAVCAWSIDPGPSATAGVPAAANRAASQNQGAAVHCAPQDSSTPTKGWFGSVLSGPEIFRLNSSSGKCSANESSSGARSWPGTLDIDPGLAEVWHDIDFTASLNRPDVEGQRAEGIVALRREGSRNLASKHVERLQYLVDRIFAELRHGSMCSPSARPNGQPYRTLVGIYGLNFVGSPTMAKSNLSLADRALTPSWPISSPMNPANEISCERRGKISRHSRSAKSIAASEPFASDAPRPKFYRLAARPRTVL